MDIITLFSNSLFLSLLTVTDGSYFQLFASKDILFAGQPVGMIVAETQELADSAANFVKIAYTSKKRPVIDVREVLQSKDTSRIFLREERNATHPTGTSILFSKKTS